MKKLIPDIIKEYKYVNYSFLIVILSSLFFFTSVNKISICFWIYRSNTISVLDKASGVGDLCFII